MVLDTFSIVPLLVGDLGPDEYSQVKNLLAPLITSETLIVVSTDFTHYGRRFGYVPFSGTIKKNLHDLDMGSIRLILQKDISGFNDYVAETGITICGNRAVSLLLRLLPKHTEGTLLDYYTSGDQTQDYSSTVSYASILFHEAPEHNPTKSDQNKKPRMDTGTAPSPAALMGLSELRRGVDLRETLRSLP